MNPRIMDLLKGLARVAPSRFMYQEDEEGLIFAVDSFVEFTEYDSSFHSWLFKEVNKLNIKAIVGKGDASMEEAFLLALIGHYAEPQCTPNVV